MQIYFFILNRPCI